MYHQFKELADLDITKNPMEVGPTTHYIMGGIRWTPTRRCRRFPGCSPPGECAAGINGANRLGGNSLSDLIVFGKRAGEHAAPARGSEPRCDPSARRPTTHTASLEPFERGTTGENPYKVQQDLQDTMQALVGIVRTEARCATRWRIDAAGARGRPGVDGSPRVPRGLAHLRSTCGICSIVSEAIARSALERRESRGGHFREDYPEQAAEFGALNMVTARRGRPDAGDAQPLRRCRRS
jgi:succinate dehydrogenase / fumarate reductase, flavoprotein subunit